MAQEESDLIAKEANLERRKRADDWRRATFILRDLTAPAAPTFNFTVSNFVLLHLWNSL